MDTTDGDEEFTDLDVVEYEEFVLPDEFERSMGISFCFSTIQLCCYYESFNYELRDFLGEV